MSKLDKDTIINNFSQAFATANGKQPSIDAKGGWYSVDGGKNVRLAQLEEMTAELQSSAPAPKTATAVKAKTKAAPKKAASKSKATKTFSVKDFYTQQILQNNAGVRPPR